MHTLTRTHRRRKGERERKSARIEYDTNIHVLGTHRAEWQLQCNEGGERIAGRRRKKISNVAIIHLAIVRRERKEIRLLLLLFALPFFPPRQPSRYR